MHWMLLALAGVALPAYGHLALRGRSGVARAVAVAPGALAALALPWAFPPALREVRFLVAVPSFLIAARLVEVACGRWADPELQRTFPRFLIYALNGPDVWWEETTDGRRRARATGRRRIGRALLGAAGFAGMLAASTAWPGIHDHPVLHYPWATLAFLGVGTAIFDLGAGTWMQTGVRIGPMFDAPLLARSPRDFWSRRWNLAFRNLMHRLVFEPIRARGFPRLGVALVFALSAAIHEYLVVAALGRTRGHMTAFFLLHGLATLADGTLARLRGGRRLLPRPLAIAAHLVWFLATTPLFFAPVLEIYSVHRWRLW